MNNCSHVYYVFGIVLNNESISEKRDLIANALKAEGVPALGIGYQNIHLNPIFINRIAYGTKSFPWIGLNQGIAKLFITMDYAQSQRNYIMKLF